MLQQLRYMCGGEAPRNATTVCTTAGCANYAMMCGDEQCECESLHRQSHLDQTKGKLFVKAIAKTDEVPIDILPVSKIIDKAIENSIINLQNLREKLLECLERHVQGKYYRLRKNIVDGQAPHSQLTGDMMSKVILELKSVQKATAETVYNMPFQGIKQSLGEIRESFDSIVWKFKSMMKEPRELQKHQSPRKMQPTKQQHAHSKPTQSNNFTQSELEARIHDTILTVDMLKPLRPKIRSLSVHNCKSSEWKIISQGIIRQCPELSILRVSRSDCGDNICLLGRHAALRTVELRECRITDSGVNILITNRQLIHLNLLGNEELSQKTVKQILCGLRKLATLELCLLKISKITLGDCGITDREVRFLVDVAPNLRELTLYNNRITAEGARIIAQKLPELVYLNLKNNDIRAEGASAIARLSKLKEVYLLDGNNFTLEQGKILRSQLPNTQFDS